MAYINGKNILSVNLTPDITRGYAHGHFANALKGEATGNPVFVVDASPLEHEMAVAVDVGGATVKKYGKNLFTVQDGTVATNKGSYDKEAQILTITDDTLVYAVTFDKPLPVGTTFSITIKMISGKTQNHCLNVGGYHMASDSGDSNVWQGQAIAEKDIDLSGKTYTTTFTATKTVERIAIQMYGDVNVLEPLVFQVQFEIGGLTDYEPYQEPVTYTADENGVVDGITADGGKMTLFADSGATITAEYNRDINKAFAELQALILGG